MHTYHPHCSLWEHLRYKPVALRKHRLTELVGTQNRCPQATTPTVWWDILCAQAASSFLLQGEKHKHTHMHRVAQIILWTPKKVMRLNFVTLPYWLVLRVKWKQRSPCLWAVPHALPTLRYLCYGRLNYIESICSFLIIKGIPGSSHRPSFLLRAWSQCPVLATLSWRVAPAQIPSQFSLRIHLFVSWICPTAHNTEWHWYKY